MKTHRITLLLLIVLLGCTPKKGEELSSETNPLSDIPLKAPSEFFPTKKIPVLVVGTFHFNYPGLDDHKTTPEHQIDVLKEPKKSEVTELVEYIKRFRPNKIALEARPEWRTMEKFEAYLNGQHRDKRDERYQLAMRIAQELSLDTLYPVDANSLRDDLWKKDSVTLNSLVGAVDWEREEPLDDHFNRWMDYDDSIIPQTNLTEYFKYMNSRESHEYGYGIYLTGGFKSENNQGADFLSLWWYNRNLRIFRNIQGITEGPEDRILVIMGNGHASVLRQLYEASPEYEFIEFDSL
ncbi:MAG: DUF5694 domain-containing protein [Bacteroidota bacterium]